jgi:hypothetical protein
MRPDQFMMVPFPFLGHAPPPDHAERLVPARVRAALSWLAQAAAKAAPRVAVNDITMQEFDGQPLDVEEVAATRAAARLLAAYFDGEFVPTKADEPPKPDRGAILTCPMCVAAGAARKKCELCGGTGVVLVLRTDASQG